MSSLKGGSFFSFSLLVGWYGAVVRCAWMPCESPLNDNNLNGCNNVVIKAMSETSGQQHFHTVRAHSLFNVFVDILYFLFISQVMIRFTETLRSRWTFNAVSTLFLLESSRYSFNTVFF